VSKTKKYATKEVLKKKNRTTTIVF